MSFYTMILNRLCSTKKIQVFKYDRLFPNIGLLKNTFVFDSELFRYLIAVQNGKLFNENECEQFDKNRKMSLKEAPCLIEFVLDAQDYLIDNWHSEKHTDFEIQLSPNKLISNISLFFSINSFFLFAHQFNYIYKFNNIKYQFLKCCLLFDYKQEEWTK